MKVFSQQAEYRQGCQPPHQAYWIVATCASRTTTSFEPHLQWLNVFRNSGQIKEDEMGGERRMYAGR
jgi:hypothetical protein